MLLRSPVSPEIQTDAKIVVLNATISSGERADGASPWVTIVEK